MEHHNREVDEMTNQTRNEVLLEGIPVGAPEPSHENHGQLFYRQILEVPRLSGTAASRTLSARVRKASASKYFSVHCMVRKTS